jgi:glucan biosynthesis protein
MMLSVSPSGRARKRERAAMFIVKWEGEAPADKAEWIAVLREVLSGELGSYYVRFQRSEKGWRFTLDWRPDDRLKDEELVANNPESVAFNLQQALTQRGKPLDPSWMPQD